jgi:hypothetical protein
LGWKDRFANADWSQRQYSYAKAQAWQVYTPQAVVQGTSGAVGSDRAKILAEIGGASRGPVHRLQVSLARNDQGFLVDVDHTIIRQPVQVALVESGLQSRVDHGENAGATLTHVDVVRYFATKQAMSTLNEADQLGRCVFNLLPQGPKLEGGSLKAVVWQQDPDFHIFSVGQSAPLKAPIQK